MPFEIYVCLFTLVIIDYATGIVGAIVNKCFSSTVMREGLIHKMAYVACFIVAFIVNYMCSYIDLGYIYGASILSIITIWIAVTEVGSIIENICVINPELKDSSIFKIFSHNEIDYYEDEEK